MVKPKDQSQPEQPSVPVPVAPSQVMLGPQLPAGYVNPQVSELNEAMRMRVPLNAKVPMGEGYWVRKNNKWNFTPKNTPSSPDRDMIVSEEQLVAERKAAFAGRVQRSLMGPVTGGIFKGDISKIVKTPFRFARSNIGSPIAGVSSNIVDAIPFTEWAENAVGSTLGFGSNYGSKAFNFAVRDNIRRTMTAAMTPLQVFENLVMFLPTMIASIPGGNADFVKSDASIWDQVRGLISDTTIGQQFAQEGALGFVNPFDESSIGTGYFPAGTAEEQRNKLEERLRPEFFGQTATVGRLFAGLGVYANLYEPGDDNHSLLSGTIDALFQVAFDPMNAFLPGSKAIKGIETFADSPTALASTRKLIKAGAAVTPETIADAERVISMMDQAGVLSERAVNLVTPQPNTYWSGDRFGYKNGPIETFYNLGPNGPATPDNLIGSAFYQSNRSPLGTSYLFAEDARGSAIDETIKFAEGVELKVPINALPEDVVYEIRVPETGFNTINGEAVWTVDPSVPWNLNAAIADLGINEENIALFEKILGEKGITATRVGHSSSAILGRLIEEITQYESSLGTELAANAKFGSVPKKLSFVDVRKILAKPEIFLQNSFRFDSASPAFIDGYVSFASSKLDDAILDENWYRTVSGNRYTYDPVTFESTREIISSSEGGSNIANAIDNNLSSGVTYHHEPVQTLEDHISHLANQLETRTIEPGSESYNFIVQQTEEAQSLLDEFKAISQKLSQETVSSEVKLVDKKLFMEGIESLKEITRKYTVFVKRSSSQWEQINSSRYQAGLEQLENSNYGGIWYNYMGDVDPSLHFINRLADALPATSGVLDQSPSVVIGDVGPFKNVKYNTDRRSAMGTITFDSHDVPGVNNPSGVDSINHWLMSKGVDGVRYDGGNRIGAGYGQHEAMAVFSAEKLGIISRTGERLPVTEAIRLSKTAEQLGLSAEEIAQARGYMESQGLIDAARKSLDGTPYNVWKISGNGRNTFNAIANDSDAYNIWKTC